MYIYVFIHPSKTLRHILDVSVLRHVNIPSLDFSSELYFQMSLRPVVNLYDSVSGDMSMIWTASVS